MDCHWEFGGNDVVTIVFAGTVDEWRRNHPWAAPRRAGILRFIADEVIRQQAPSCVAEIDSKTGHILLRASKTVAPKDPALWQKDVAWVTRYRDLRMKFALVVLAATVLLGGAAWVKSRVLVIDAGDGIPVGLTVRTSTHIATLIRRLVPYTPSLNRDPSKDRYDISVFLVPLDGNEPRLLPVAENLAPNEFALAKILGSDGQKLWIDGNTTWTVDLSTYELQVATGTPPRSLDGGSASPFPPRPEHYLAAGFYTGPDTWLGLHSDTEIQRDYQPGKRVRRIVPAEDRKEMRSFFAGQLDGELIASSQAVVSMTRLDGGPYLNGALLRLDEKSEPLLLDNPPGGLMIFTSEPGLKGELVVARVDHSGRLLWQADTGIDRFNLQQILPGKDTTAFVGTRPREEGKVPEPLLIIVNHTTGEMRTISLWQ